MRKPKCFKAETKEEEKKRKKRLEEAQRFIERTGASIKDGTGHFQVGLWKEHVRIV